MTIGLDPTDNAFAIFETLNATGQALSQADLVRNYFFMRTNQDSHDQIYREEWLPVERTVPEKDRSEFFRHFLIMRSERFVREDSVYAELKAWLDPEEEAGVRKELHGMLHHAEAYSRIIAPADREVVAEIRERMVALNTLEATVGYPLLLRIYERQSRGQIDANEVARSLDALENFLVRRFVCGVLRGSLNRIFPTLFNVVLNAAAGRSFAATLAEVLATHDYPSDEEFEEKLASIRLYGGTRTPRAKLILQRLLLVGRETPAATSLTVEHLVPQTLSEAWKRALGDDAEAIVEDKLHTLGNLTLTAYNTELSNSVWTEKRKLLQESGIAANRELAAADEWNAAQIMARGARLAQRALTIWPHLAPSASQTVSVTGTKPRAVLVAGQRCEVATWQDVLRVTMDSIGAIASERLPQISRSYPNHLGRDRSRFRSPGELAGGWWYETHLSAEAINRNCRRFAQIAGLPLADFSVEFA